MYVFALNEQKNKTSKKKKPSNTLDLFIETLNKTNGFVV